MPDPKQPKEAEFEALDDISTEDEIDTALSDQAKSPSIKMSAKQPVSLGLAVIIGLFSALAGGAIGIVGTGRNGVEHGAFAPAEVKLDIGRHEQALAALRAELANLDENLKTLKLQLEALSEDEELLLRLAEIEERLQSSKEDTEENPTTPILSLNEVLEQNKNASVQPLTPVMIIGDADYTAESVAGLDDVFKTRVEALENKVTEFSDTLAGIGTKISELETSPQKDEVSALADDIAGIKARLASLQTPKLLEDGPALQAMSIDINALDNLLLQLKQLERDTQKSDKVQTQKGLLQHMISLGWAIENSYLAGETFDKEIASLLALKTKLPDFDFSKLEESHAHLTAPPKAVFAEEMAAYLKLQSANSNDEDETINNGVLGFLQLSDLVEIRNKSEETDISEKDALTDETDLRALTALIDADRELAALNMIGKLPEDQKKHFEQTRQSLEARRQFLTELTALQHLALTAWQEADKSDD